MPTNLIAKIRHTDIGKGGGKIVDCEMDKKLLFPPPGDHKKTETLHRHIEQLKAGIYVNTDIDQIKIELKCSFLVSIYRKGELPNDNTVEILDNFRGVLEARNPETITS